MKEEEEIFRKKSSSKTNPKFIEVFRDVQIVDNNKFSSLFDFMTYQNLFLYCMCL